HPVARNDVTGKRRAIGAARQRIENAASRRLAEVALPFQRRRDRDRGQRRRTFAPPKLLVSGKEEYAVADHRAAERATEVVALELRQVAHQVERPRVELLVAVI